MNRFLTQWFKGRRSRLHAHVQEQRAVLASVGRELEKIGHQVEEDGAWLDGLSAAVGRLQEMDDTDRNGPEGQALLEKLQGWEGGAEGAPATGAWLSSVAQRLVREKEVCRAKLDRLGSLAAGHKALQQLVNEEMAHAFAWGEDLGRVAEFLLTEFGSEWEQDCAAGLQSMEQALSARFHCDAQGARVLLILLAESGLLAYIRETDGEPLVFRPSENEFNEEDPCLIEPLYAEDGQPRRGYWRIGRMGD